MAKLQSPPKCLSAYFILLVVESICIQQTESASVLMVPLNVPSHVSMYIHIGNQLKTKGHNVTIVLPDGYHIEDESKLSKLTVERYKLGRAIDIRDEEWTHEGLILALNGSNYAIMNFSIAQIESLKKTCESVIKDEELISKVARRKYDIALVDILTCMGLLPYKLNIPYSAIGFNCYQQRWPDIYSFLPYITTTYTDRMTFFQRVQNFLLYWLFELHFGLDSDDSLCRTYIPERKPMTYTEMRIEPDVCFMLREHVTDFPRPLPAHAFYIGHILGRPATPLKEKLLKSFVEEAPDGIIIVCFGTWLDKLPVNIMKTLIEAFRGIKQRVVMRYKGDETFDIPSNVKIVSWLPQNDLLGHPKTRLIIFHGGANSLHEIAYHGVPSIAIPLLLDQAHNSAIIKSKNYGVTLDIRELTSNKLKEAIQYVLNNKEIKTNAQHIKQIMQNKRESGLDVLDYWINYLIKFGGGFLRSKAQFEMPGYAYYSEDVKLFLFGIAALILYVEYKILRIICSYCCRKSTKSKQE